MLEYFYLDVSGITPRNYEISLTTSMNKIYYRFTYEADVSYVREGERYYGDEWSRNFEGLRFYEWDPEYTADSIVVGEGYAWEIFYKETGSPSRFIKGFSMIPPKWEEMIGLLDELDPESLVHDLTNLPECSDIR